MMPLYLVAVDLGQVADYTAMAIAQRKTERWGHMAEQHYFVRFLHRFPLSTPYGGRCLHGIAPRMPCRHCPQGLSIGGIVEQVRARLKALPVPDGWYRDVPQIVEDLVTFPRQQAPYELLLDFTGVGRGVADMFKGADEWPICITITAGNAVTEPERGIWHVAKRQLISPFQVALQTRRFHVINNEMGRILMQEGVNFQYKMSKLAGDEQYGAWREGEHDDILLACALLVWWGEQTAPMFRSAGDEDAQYAVATGNPLFARGSA